MKSLIGSIVNKHNRSSFSHPVIICDHKDTLQISEHNMSDVPPALLSDSAGGRGEQTAFGWSLGLI